MQLLILAQMMAKVIQESDDVINNYKHFYRIREEDGSGRPPTVHLRTDDVT